MNNKFILGILILIVIVVAIFGVSRIMSPSETGKVVSKNAPVKEFVIKSFYDDKGIWFSLKEISVNKGDLVRIKITNIKGMHDFVIDEYNIKKITPLNEEVVIEFTADKAGEFIYYCSVTGHRQKGQWGTLKVIG